MAEKKESFFIITVDTEGDALWSKTVNDTVSTENAVYIPRFQELCESFDLKPTYLVNYEMANNEYFVNYIKPKISQGLCEIGMHLHAWNMPGSQNLVERTDIKPGKPFLIEYSESIMEEKIAVMTELIEKRFCVKPVSHRAGRWAIDERYGKLLCKYGYKADCSITPYINWTGNPGYTQGFYGPDYSRYSNRPYRFYVDEQNSTLWEVPMTIKKKLKYFYRPRCWSYNEIKHCLRCALIGQDTWMRLLNNEFRAQKEIIKTNNENYIMFMLHSSELMPGSRYFPDKKATDIFMSNMRQLFGYAKELSYRGTTLKEYVSTLDQGLVKSYD